MRIMKKFPLAIKIIITCVLCLGLAALIALFVEYIF